MLFNKKMAANKRAKAPCVSSTVKTEELKNEKTAKKNSPKYLAEIFKLFSIIKYNETKTMLMTTPQVPKFIKPSDTKPLFAAMSGLLK